MDEYVVRNTVTGLCGGTSTCSKCGMDAMSHDLWVGM